MLQQKISAQIRLPHPAQDYHPSLIRSKAVDFSRHPVNGVWAAPNKYVNYKPKLNPSSENLSDMFWTAFRLFVFGVKKKSLVQPTHICGGYVEKGFIFFGMINITWFICQFISAQNMIKFLTIYSQLYKSFFASFFKCNSETTFSIKRIQHYPLSKEHSP